MANLDPVLRGLRRRREHLQPVETRLIGNSRRSSLLMATGSIERNRVRQQRVFEEFRNLTRSRLELQATLSLELQATLS